MPRNTAREKSRQSNREGALPPVPAGLPRDIFCNKKEQAMTATTPLLRKSSFVHCNGLAHKHVGKASCRRPG